MELFKKTVECIVYLSFYYWSAHSVIFLILNYKNLSLTFPYIWAIMGIILMIQNLLKIIFKRGKENE